MNSSSVATLKTGVWKRVTEMKICPKGTRLRMNCVGCSGRRAGGSQNVLGVEQRYPTFPSPTPSIRRSAMSLKHNQNKTLLPLPHCHQSQSTVHTSNPCFHFKHPPKKVDNSWMLLLCLPAIQDL